MATLALRFGLGSTVGIGVVAGIIFALFEMLAAAVMMGPEAATMPLRMIGAMILGSQALDPGYSLAVAATAGVAVHMVLSVVFAVVFAGIASLIASDWLTTPGNLAIAGFFFGLALWLVNFYVIAPLAGWRWFPEDADPMVQFLAHTLFFGCPVGWMLGRSRTVIGTSL